MLLFWNPPPPRSFLTEEGTPSYIHAQLSYYGCNVSRLNLLKCERSDLTTFPPYLPPPSLRANVIIEWPSKHQTVFYLS